MTSNASPPYDWIPLGETAFAHAEEVQAARWEAVVAGEAPAAIMTFEPTPVVTLGRRASLDDLLVSEAQLSAAGIDVVRVDRGGQVTFHGPGQLVVYVIASLPELGIGPSTLVRRLTDSIAAELRELGIDGHYDADHPGIWVDGAKICAVGMRVSRGVSRYGAALNLTTALDAFELFVPCGMPGARATSVLQQLGRSPSHDELAARVARRAGAAYGLSPRRPAG